MSDKEDAAAALGNSEVLSVQHSVGEPIPEVSQRPDNGTHISSVVGGQKSRDVLSEEPTGVCLIKESHDLPPQP
jgi:hypothetical protein